MCWLGTKEASNIIALFAALISIASIIFINRNTNKQIRNQNKNTYMPRLRITNVKLMKKIGNPVYSLSNSTDDEDDWSNYGEGFKALMEIENIGSGVANDICFYNLKTGEQCFRSSNLSKSDKTASTEEIAKNSTGEYNFYIQEDENAKENDELTFKNAYVLYIDYLDLQNNHYSIICYLIISSIGILNELSPCSFGYYQENTPAYDRMIQKNNENYKKIKRLINKNSSI